ncbi:GPO family capsid scaffolding protein [Serratia marcescens]|uniref:GPO family capsid scaffolding protein n=1 Tax=Serratia marcescens TaxID=615 RepID=UPI0024C4E4D2|nr:GPO family capsid scaffolding protein [Serratia marcescens]MDK1707021.1 GPO family capsid scaffolding protein [Serratia marcescens]
MASKKKVSDWTRIAVEGATTDGREIQREWLTGAAASFDRDLYGARINIEHIRGMAPNGDFGSYGDIVALKAEEITEGKLAGKMALYAQIEPTDALVELNRKKQKVYSSIEINPDFADTKTPYLVGMAVTDNPASLGTDYMRFCAQNPAASPLASRHSAEGCVFTAAEEIALNFTEQSGEGTESGAQFFSKISALLFGNARRQAQDTTEIQNAVELVAKSQGDLLDKFGTLTPQHCHDELARKFTALEQDYNALKAQLADEPQHFAQRPPATGGNHETVVLAEF